MYLAVLIDVRARALLTAPGARDTRRVASLMSELSMAVSGGLPKDHILEMANGLGAGRKVRGSPRFEFMNLLVALQIVCKIYPLTSPRSAPSGVRVRSATAALSWHATPARSVLGKLSLSLRYSVPRGRWGSTGKRR